MGRLGSSAADFAWAHLVGYTELEGRLQGEVLDGLSFAYQFMMAVHRGTCVPLHVASHPLVGLACAVISGKHPRRAEADVAGPLVASARKSHKVTSAIYRTWSKHVTRPAQIQEVGKKLLPV